MITETVFAIPGAGRLMIDRIYGRDYPVIQGLTLALALLVSLIFLVTDMRAGGARSEGERDERDGAARRIVPRAAGALPRHPRRRHGDPAGADPAPAPSVPGWFAPYDPLAFDYDAHPASRRACAHPFGTDNFGRDMLSRVIWATRIDMQIAIFATALSRRSSARIVGALVGYYGGWLDMLFGRVVDLVVTFPFLVLVIAIVVGARARARQHVSSPSASSAGCSMPG